MNRAPVLAVAAVVLGVATPSFAVTTERVYTGVGCLPVDSYGGIDSTGFYGSGGSSSSGAAICPMDNWWSATASLDYNGWDITSEYVDFYNYNTTVGVSAAVCGADKATAICTAFKSSTASGHVHLSFSQSELTAAGVDSKTMQFLIAYVPPPVSGNYSHLLGHYATYDTTGSTGTSLGFHSTNCRGGISWYSGVAYSMANLNPSIWSYAYCPVTEDSDHSAYGSATSVVVDAGPASSGNYPYAQACVTFTGGGGSCGAWTQTTGAPPFDTVIYPSISSWSAYPGNYAFVAFALPPKPSSGYASQIADYLVKF